MWSVRIGYACINLTLEQKVRTVRLANATPERVQELARENLAGVRRAAEWNASHGIGLYRLSSDLVPFAGREDVASEWREALADDFRKTGRALRRHGQRVSAHPGQYTVLNSPRPHVVAAAARDLEAQAAYFDLMNVPGNLVVHLGGAFGEREPALARFVTEALRLPETVLRKLVIENDDRTWPLADALRAFEETSLPVVYDALHDAVLPSDGLAPRDALAAALATWPRGRTPKVHYSDQDPEKAPGAHAWGASPAAFAAWVDGTRGLGDFDVMVEAKGKEQAVLPLLANARAVA